MLVGSRDAEDGKKAVADLQATGSIKGTLTDVQIDVHDDASIDALVKFIQDKYGQLDMLISNARVEELVISATSSIRLTVSQSPI